MPWRLWDYALVWCTKILSRTHNLKSGRTGIERLTGDTPDISEWIDFDLYDRVWFWDMPGKEENPKPGRWLGVSNRIGGALCYWVVDSWGHIFLRTTVQHVTAQDLKSDDIHQQFEKFDRSLGECLNNENFTTSADGIAHMLYEEDLEGDYPDVPNPYDPPLHQVTLKKIAIYLMNTSELSSSSTLDLTVVPGKELSPSASKVKMAGT